MDLSSFDFLPLGEDTEILPFDCNDTDLNNFLPYLKWNGKLRDNVGGIFAALAGTPFSEQMEEVVDSILTLP